jgi:thioesterase domain-containing protein
MMAGRPDDQQTPRPEGKGGVFPCTLMQERLWSQVRSGRPYGLNVAMRWLVTGRLTRDVAQRALQGLVDRHEILRTCLREVDGVPKQVILPACPIKLRSIDLTALDADAAMARAEEIAREEAGELMDLGEAPLFRAGLLRLASDRSMLLLTFHATVADGWSIGLLISEFQAAVKAIEAGSAPDTSEPELQVADYALWERELVASGALEEQRQYWQRKLRGVAGTTVPGDHERAERRGSRSEVVSTLLPSGLSAAIDGFASRHGFTLYGLAVSALALLLHRVTGEAKIVVGSQVAHREEPIAETLAGPTVNSITLCLPVDDHATLLTFARMTADEVQEALHHQELPFEVAVPAGTATRLHAINVVVQRSYSSTLNAEPADGKIGLRPLPSFSAGAQWDLNFFLVWRDEGWRMSCDADIDLYDEATVTELLDGWRTCLEALVTSPDQRLADCPAIADIPTRAKTKPSEAPSTEASGPGGHREPIALHDPAQQVARFHENGSRTPMIAMNNRSVYYQLARAMGEDRPFIDIQTFHPDGPLDLSGYSFEEFATYAVRLIRWAQPNGPYLLGGHCVYGALAFEAARQLQRMGEEIELVCLFDTWAPGYREAMSRKNQERRRRQLRTRARLNRIEQYRKGEIDLKDLVWRPIARRLGVRMVEEAEPTEANLFTGRWFDDHIREAAAHHRPAPANIDAVIFRSAEPLRGTLFDERMGWAPIVAGKLYQADIDSAHLDMFQEKPAAAIASFLGPLLAGIEGRRNG